METYFLKMPEQVRHLRNSFETASFYFTTMSQDVAHLVDHYFREEYGKGVSYLTAKFGARYIELAEDAVQEALLKAMQTWPFSKVPDNPSGWIIKVAGNKMIDSIRKNSRIDHTESLPEQISFSTEFTLDTIKDDLVKMMFACCHASLSAEYQIILTLKILGGLSIKEISRALLKNEEAIAKSYTRAKKKFQEEKIQLDLPGSHEIKNRLKTVLQVIYLLFNEGYKTTQGDELVKKELCQEAIRLNGILLDNDLCNGSLANGLMALMHFHSARFDARVDEKGYLVTLEYQDRKKWNQQHIDAGIRYLQQATQGAFLNEYYLQAVISGIHCQTEKYSETNWSEILELYNMIYSINPSPMVRLNRVVALSKSGDFDKAFSELAVLENHKQIKGHYLFYAVKGDILIDKGDINEGKNALKHAIYLAKNGKEKDYLNRKIKRL